MDLFKHVFNVIRIVTMKEYPLSEIKQQLFRWIFRISQFFQSACDHSYTSSIIVIPFAESYLASCRVLSFPDGSITLVDHLS